VLLLLIASALWPGSFSPLEGWSSQSPGTPSAKPEMAQVWVSAISVDPKELHYERGPKMPISVVTVQIAHYPLNTPQTVTLEVGTSSTDPPGLNGVATYNPSSQTITIPKGALGSFVATAKLSVGDIGAKSSAKLIISASLANPSPGIKIADSVSPDDYLVSLTIKKP
jgi:hypothetical protein